MNQIILGNNDSPCRVIVVYSDWFEASGRLHDDVRPDVDPEAGQDPERQPGAPCDHRDERLVTVS